MSDDRESIQGIYEAIYESKGLHPPRLQSLEGKSAAPVDEVDKAYQRLKELPEDSVHGVLLRHLSINDVIAALMQYYMASRIADWFEDWSSDVIESRDSVHGPGGRPGTRVKTPESTIDWDADRWLAEFQQSTAFQWTDAIEDAEEQFKDTVGFIGHMDLKKLIKNNLDIFNGFKAHNFDDIINNAVTASRRTEELDEFDI